MAENGGEGREGAIIDCRYDEDLERYVWRCDSRPGGKGANVGGSGSGQRAGGKVLLGFVDDDRF